MNKRIIAPLLIGATVALASGAAAANDSIYPVTYAAALERALGSRPEIAVERANADGAAARVAEAEGAFLPVLDVSSTAQRTRLYDDFSPVNINASFNNSNIPVTVQRNVSPYQVGTGVELSYNLYAGGAHLSRLTEARAAQRAAHAQEMSARKRVILDVTAAYWELRKAEVAYSKVQRARDYAGDEAVVANEQFQQGRLAKVELDAKLLAAEVQELELSNAMRSLQNYRRHYFSAIGLSLAVQEPPALELQNTATDVDVETILRGLVQMRAPALATALADHDMAKASADQVRAEYLPKLDFFVHYDGIGRSQSSFGDAAGRFGRDATTIGIRLKWNLFDGFRTDNRAKQAYAASESKRLNIEQVKRQATNEWLDKLSQETAVRNQLRLAEKQLELSQAQLTIARQRFKARLISDLQLRLAQFAAEDARGKVETARIDLLVSTVERYLAAVE